MESINFDINDALKHYMSDPASIATPEADSALVDCEAEPETLTIGIINPVLNSIVDAVAENPDSITRSAYFDSLQFLLKCVSTSIAPRWPSGEGELPQLVSRLSTCSSVSRRHRSSASQIRREPPF